MKSASNLTWRECYDKLVEELCGDILFEEDHRDVLTAAYIGYLMTLVLRPGIKGGCPGYLFTANEAGTGKSTAIQIGMTLAYGKQAQSTDWAKGEEERFKVLISKLASGAGALLHDNIELGTEVADGNYAEMITSGEITGRKLGKSEIMGFECKLACVFGGNSITVTTELARRLSFINLETLTARPESRKVSDPDILGTVKRERKRLLGYLFRMIELGAEMEIKLNRRLGVGTFWDEMVRNPILTETGIDIADRVGAKVEGASESGEDFETAVELIQDLMDAEGVEEFTSRWLFNLVNSQEEETGTPVTNVRDAMVNLNGFSWKSTKSLGRALGKIVNRPTTTGLILKRQKRSGKPIVYYMVKFDPESSVLSGAGLDDD
jgi:hypothetical protein